jgi:hypothetical protein
MALSSLQSHELLKLINEKVRGKRSQNSYSPLEDYNISTSTLRRYIKEMRLVEVKADTKSTARQEAHTDLRNFMALSAVLSVLYKVTSHEHVYSSDDVSIVLNGWNEKPRVLTTKEKKELLHAQHIGVSTTEATEKRHVISFNVTVGGSGDVPCIVAKIYDRRFPESMKEKPRVYNVGDNLFIMLLHSDTAETLVTSTQYKAASYLAATAPEQVRCCAIWTRHREPPRSPPSPAWAGTSKPSADPTSSWRCCATARSHRSPPF